MNRDELLTKLAMELSEWPESEGVAPRGWEEDGFIWTVCLGSNGFEVSLARGFHRRQGFEAIREEHWLQRRAELINKPSWDDAPDEAGWLGQNAAGQWRWYSVCPVLADNHRWTLGDPCWLASEGKIPAGHRWDRTMEERPVTTGVNGKLNRHRLYESGRVDRVFRPQYLSDIMTDCKRCGRQYDSTQFDECRSCFGNTSDGSTASYYELPEGATDLQDLISHRNLNAQDGEIFRAIYRKGRASHSDELRDAKKVLFYAQAEVERLERMG